jgi:chromosome segregation ATPase
VLIQASSLSAKNKKMALDAMSGGQEDIPPAAAQAMKAHEQQVQQITQAQQQKAQEQQQEAASIDTEKAHLEVFKAQLVGHQAELKSQAASFDAQNATLDAKLVKIQAAIATLSAKEVEVKSMELVASANLEAMQQSAKAIDSNSAQANAVDTLTAKMAQMQAEHKQRFAEQAISHQEALTKASEPEAKAAAEKAKQPKSITVQRDKTGRIAGATIQ